MDYKVQLDIFDFRNNKFWILDDLIASETADNIKRDLLLHLGQLESGILNQQNEQFIIFTQEFQNLCLQCSDDLSCLIQPKHTDIFLKSLTGLDSFDYINQLLEILFELTKDMNIKIYLYNNDFIDILFELYYKDESYFIHLCKILSSYFINSKEEIHQRILKYRNNKKQKTGQETEQKEKAFFKELLSYANDTNPKNKEFAHSALFLLSTIISNNENLSFKKIQRITDVLINRLDFNPEETDLSDIVYCFCCLIKNYPQHMILYSQTKVILRFPIIFWKKQNENEFVRYLIFLQHLLYCNGTHISYFIDQIHLFLQIIERISNLSELPEIVIIASIKALFFGVAQIPDLVSILIESGVLDLLNIINEQCQFSIKEVAYQLLILMMEKADENSEMNILNSKIMIDILSTFDYFSIEFLEIFFKGLIIAFEKIKKENLESISVDVKNKIQEITESEYENIHFYSQKILSLLTE